MLARLPTGLHDCLTSAAILRLEAGMIGLRSSLDMSSAV